jgi:hypothetical protein
LVAVLRPCIILIDIYPDVEVVLAEVLEDFGGLHSAGCPMGLTPDLSEENRQESVIELRGKGFSLVGHDRELEIVLVILVYTIYYQLAIFVADELADVVPNSGHNVQVFGSFHDFFLLFFFCPLGADYGDLYHTRRPFKGGRRKSFLTGNEKVFLSD